MVMGSRRGGLRGLCLGASALVVAGLTVMVPVAPADAEANDPSPAATAAHDTAAPQGPAPSGAADPGPTPSGEPPPPPPQVRHSTDTPPPPAGRRVGPPRPNDRKAPSTHPGSDSETNSGTSTPQLYGLQAVTANGSISGTVRDAATTGISGVWIYAYDSSDNLVKSASTSATGTYTLADLPPASYKLDFWPGSGNFVAEWYNDKPTPAAADLVAVASGADHGGIDATLATGGIITGRVTNASGTGIPNISVAAYSGTTYVNSSSTDSSGNYSISRLPSGSLKVEFADYSSGTYAGEWYDDKSSSGAANGVPVTAGATTANINAVLGAGGAISGTLRSAAGEPLPDACVFAYTASDDYAAYANVAADGSFTFAHLAPGSYKVFFDPCGATNNLAEWYNNRATQAAADLISVLNGATTTVSADLAVGGRIIGTVRNVTNAPIASVCADAYVGEDWKGGAYTAADGTYEIFGLPTGNYTVNFVPCEAGNYLPEWYNDKPDQVTANPVAVTAGGTTAGIDAVLANGNSISGTITTEHGTPLSNACAYARTSETTTVESDGTDADGNYRLEPLPAGSYRIYFANCSGTGLVPEWYLNKADFASATPVTVSGGTDSTGVNGTLAIQPGSGVISGRVTNSGGAGVPSVCVSIYDSLRNYRGSGFTGSNGNYVVTALPPNSYHVQFRNCGDGNVAYEWYSDKANYSTSDVVEVTAGNETFGVDANLVTGARISGVVTNSAGAALKDTCVDAFEGRSGIYASSKRTDAAGGYALDSLPAGSYTVRFSDCDGMAPALLTEWYDNQPYQSSAQLVSVSAGGQVTGINAVLSSGGKITGTVTGPGPLQGVCVSASPQSAGQYGSSTTGADGTYTLSLAPGTYKVFFDNCDVVNNLDEYYNDTTSWSAAQLLTVVAGQTLSGINADLAPGGTISGVVTGPTGSPLAGICVNASGGGGGAYATSKSDGTYRLIGLNTASYSVSFYGCGANYASEFYNDAYRYADVDYVSVVATQDTPGISASVQPGGVISGTVRDEAGHPLWGICVSPTSSGSEFTAGATRTDQDGKYTSAALTPGDVKLYFAICSDREGNYAPEYFDNKATLTDATPIPVASAQSVSGKDVVLSAGAAVAGKVTNSSGTGLRGICVSVSNQTSGAPGGFTTTDSSGDYTIRNLRAGNYKISFSDCVGTGYVTEWYNDKSSEAAADVLALTTGQLMSSVNAVLEQPPPATLPGRYTPLNPARILDTRSTTPLGPGQSRDIQVTGVGGVPASGVSAVVMNVTAVSPTANGGFLTVFPAGAARPTASNLNFDAGQTVPNLVTVKLGSGGKVSVYNQTGSTHVLFDVAGYYGVDPSGTDGVYRPLTPSRILDTRSTTPLGPAQSRDIQVAGQGGVPTTGVSAVVLNVTAVSPTANGGFLTVHPTGTTRPTASNLNFNAGQTVANRVIVKIGTAGKVTLYNQTGNTHVVFDVAGWFTDATSSGGPTGAFTAISPSRILDTRSSTPIGAGETRAIQIAGVGGIPAGAWPSGASAVVMNVTVTQPTANGGFIKVFPTGASAPTVSDVNFNAGKTVPNLVIVKLGPDGKVNLYNQTGTAHVIFDVVGWYQ